MMKKSLILLTFLSFISVLASAQSFNATFNYQSFRPYIHFQLTLGNQPRTFDSYQSSYIKGYMDGVNDSYYSGYRFNELVFDLEAYKIGYRDGLRDQRLFCDLNGYRRVPHSPFAYNDYYSPYYSVQIWLNQLSFTFLQAPSYRLPHRWAYNVRPVVKTYRARFHKKHYRTRFKKHYRSQLGQLRQRASRSREKYHKARRAAPTRNRSHAHIAPNQSRTRSNAKQSIRQRARKTMPQRSSHPVMHKTTPRTSAPSHVRSRSHSAPKSSSVKKHSPVKTRSSHKARHSRTKTRHVKAAPKHKARQKSTKRSHRSRGRRGGH